VERVFEVPVLDVPAVEVLVLDEPAVEVLVLDEPAVEAPVVERVKRAFDRAEWTMRDEAYQLEAPTLWDVDFRTAVAQAELEDREMPGAYHRIRFALDGDAGGAGVEIETTRPELIPACVALVAHPDDPKYRPLFGKMDQVPTGDQGGQQVVSGREGEAERPGELPGRHRAGRRRDVVEDPHRALHRLEVTSALAAHAPSVRPRRRGGNPDG